MKRLLLFAVLLFAALLTKAQTVSALPPGKYAAKIKTDQKGWEKGDIVLLDDGHYRLSSSSEVGEYRFSVAAQRIFFTSGPLKSVYTKVTLSNNKPVIILPTEQNADLGLPAEVWASKQ